MTPVREAKAYRIITPLIVRLTTVLCDDEETGRARQDEGWDVETAKVHENIAWNKG